MRPYVGPAPAFILEESRPGPSTTKGQAGSPLVTRDEFADGFAERLRHVLQKNEDERVARSVFVTASLLDRAMFATETLVQSNRNLDAAIAELSLFTFDAIETHSEALRS
jgi:hypothetical protein